MIYCVDFAAVRQDLQRRGFEEVGADEDFIVFEHHDDHRIVTIHPPNMLGHLPESLINDAYDAAGLEPKTWAVFWCD